MFHRVMLHDVAEPMQRLPWLTSWLTFKLTTSPTVPITTSIQMTATEKLCFMYRYFIMTFSASTLILFTK
jgi:hypothetical protein